MKKKYLVVANWKMNPETLEEAKLISQSIKRDAAKLKRTEVVICPSFLHLMQISKVLPSKNLSLGAQTSNDRNYGAYTGEVSPTQIKDLGAKYVILGHSERRTIGESDEVINLKVRTALSLGLSPIICVGEKERDQDGRYLQFIKDQLSKNLSGISKKDMMSVVVAYEPIWAIGKTYKNSLSATDMHEMSLFIRKFLSEMLGKDYGWNVRVLYGGSVEAENAATLMEKGEISGFLCGHASLVPKEFREILKITDSAK